MKQNVSHHIFKTCECTIYIDISITSGLLLPKLHGTSSINISHDSGMKYGVYHVFRRGKLIGSFESKNGNAGEVIGEGYARFVQDKQLIEICSEDGNYLNNIPMGDKKIKCLTDTSLFNSIKLLLRTCGMLKWLPEVAKIRKEMLKKE